MRNITLLMGLLLGTVVFAEATPEAPKLEATHSADPSIAVAATDEHHDATVAVAKTDDHKGMTADHHHDAVKGARKCHVNRCAANDATTVLNGGVVHHGKKHHGKKKSKKADAAHKDTKAAMAEVHPAETKSDEHKA